MRTHSSPISDGGSRNADDAAASSPPRHDSAPAKAAFLLQLDDPCGAADVGLRGRIQHLSTLDGGNFASTADLLDLIRRILESARRDP